ncbi:hypothetical protein FEM48_Zijuj09G0079900 [Ziziphus jujuba var. spinosa]|uniref:Uncharacterized protein n=1 Tax=Ziziphus jujuba var. spinosa TaxID=714518 RepID=A0A978URS8_ZIZJJ|nr:hypothetical protein FEM48_Zijuj09G0079900 [Ziziphus jujuba var. spinosa]
MNPFQSYYCLYYYSSPGYPSTPSFDDPRTLHRYPNCRNQTPVAGTENVVANGDRQGSDEWTGSGAVVQVVALLGSSIVWWLAGGCCLLGTNPSPISKSSESNPGCRNRKCGGEWQSARERRVDWVRCDCSSGGVAWEFNRVVAGRWLLPARVSILFYEIVLSLLCIVFYEMRNPTVVIRLSKMYHKRGLWAIKAKKGSVFPCHDPKPATENPPQKPPKFYPADDVKKLLVNKRSTSPPSSGKTDPYVILSLGDQVIRSKKNSETTVIGPPGEPIWNQVELGKGAAHYGAQKSDAMNMTDEESENLHKQLFVQIYKKLRTT